MIDEPASSSLKPFNDNIYVAFHVMITPSTLFLEGIFPGRSNRLIRTYELDINKVACQLRGWSNITVPLRSGSRVHQIVSGLFLLQLRVSIPCLLRVCSKRTAIWCAVYIFFRACLVILCKSVKPFKDKRRAWRRTHECDDYQKWTSRNWIETCSLPSSICCAIVPGFHWRRIRWSVGDFAYRRHRHSGQ